jgi:hypothetical protein
MIGTGGPPLSSAASTPDAPTMILATQTLPGTGRTTRPAPPREVADPPRSAPHDSEPPVEVVRTELRARWTALADAISDHGVDVGADVDLEAEELDDDPPPDAAPPPDLPLPPPVVIRPRRDTAQIKAPEPPEIDPHAFADADPDDDVDVRDEFLEDPAADLLAPLAPSSPSSPTGRKTPPPFPLREPTLILSEHAAATPPPAGAGTASSGPVATPFSEEIVVTERRVHERWSAASPVHALRDENVARKPATDPSTRAASEPLRADLGDEMDEPSIMPPAPVDDDDEDLGEPPADEPPIRPSDPGLPSGTDFARELRRKMSAMAQRLFKSPDEQPDAPVDVRPRHDHNSEIDLAALVDSPVAAGVTEIEARDEAESREDTPGTSDTQVRLGAESGDIIRGVSDAAAILSRAFAQAFTGRAVLRRADVEKSIFFDRGRPVFAASNQGHDRMGQLLVREGKITPEQFSRCQTLVAASGRRMGEILIDLGYLKRRELLPAVRRHVEDMIYSVFAWNTGQFQMVAGDGASGEKIRLSRHPAGMILEGVRRKLAAPELERLVGPPTTVVELGDKEKLATLLGTADLSAEERAAVAALDGTNDLAAVARISNVELTNVLQLAWGLIVLGVAHARRRDVDLDGDEGGVLVGETDLAIDRERVRARWSLVSDADYFALLGVRRDASGFEIKRAYEAARRDFAPEGFPAELRRELARELDDIAHVLDEAYHVLRDDHLRGAYLGHLRD